MKYKPVPADHPVYVMVKEDVLMAFWSTDD